MITPSRVDEPDDLGIALVFLPWNAAPAAAATLEGLLASVARIPVYMPAGSTASALRDAIPDAERDRLIVLEDAGVRPGSVLNAVARRVPGADLVVIGDSVVLAAGWLTTLGSAVHVDDTVAGATARTAILDAWFIDGQDESPTSVSNAEPDDAGPPLHPRIPYPWPQCAWLRHPAIDLTGGFDESVAHPAGVLAAFAAAALGHGLSCTLADDLCLPLAPDGLGPWPEADQRELISRHPALRAVAPPRTVSEPGPLRRSVMAARASRAGLSLTVDVRALGPGIGGTQTYVGGLVHALARCDRLSLRALIADDASAALTDSLTGAGVELVTHRQASGDVRRSDIVHRPQQVFSAADLRLLRRVGDRVVLSHMDLISYRNPSYHASVDAWMDYRRATRLALGVADRTVFFSQHARHDAVAEELVDPDRTAIAGVGVAALSADEPRSRPPALPGDREFLLMLGADYTHKNRPFVMALAGELRTRHGWQGLLVLAGAHQPFGSSAAAEREMLRANPQLADRVVDLGRVSEAEKRWLMGAAQAHVCASDYEGFGLSPLEAAAAGRPCIYAPCTSLREIIDPAAATIVPWDVGSSAVAAADLLRAGPPRERHQRLLAEALNRYSWDRVTEDLLDCYQEAIRSPYPSSAPSVWHEAERDAVITKLETSRAELQARVAHGQLLIDSQGALLTTAQQRGLMRIASRRWLRGLLAPFGLLGSIRETQRPADRKPR